MCILTYLPPTVAPDLDALHGGALANPHGHGYAVVAGDRIVAGHGLDPDQVITEFATVRAEFGDGPALFHSRLATHGIIDPLNCHPFAVGGDEHTVLAHNGVLPEIVHPAPGDPRSDTRVFAEDYLPRAPFGSLDTTEGRERLHTWLRGNKMVILTVEPTAGQRAYVLNEDLGYRTQEGIWYSNLSYRDGANYRTYLTYSAEDFEELCCVGCGGYGPEPFDTPAAHCPDCGFCGFCYQPFPHCECHAPHGRDRYSDVPDFLALS